MSAPVVVQLWEESERGWGVRPDGYSIHRTEADRAEYVEGYMTRQQALLGDAVPDEYTRPAGLGFAGFADEDDMAELGEKNGRMFYRSWSAVLRVPADVQRQGDTQ